MSIDNFSEVFDQINNIYPQKVINIVDGNIGPLDKRTKLMFRDILGKDLASYYFVYEPDKPPAVTQSSLAAYRNDAIKRSDTGIIFIQTDEPSDKPSLKFTHSKIPLTEQLVELLTMLYFRAKGYMVEHALWTYNGVDDVVAWKSPFLEKLQAHKLIEYGCYVDELRWLREFKRPSYSKQEKAPDEFILVEAESCIKNTISSSKDSGINQLKRANKLAVANKLFITFTIHFPVPQATSFEELTHEIQRDEKIGIICWEPQKCRFADSGEFEHSQMTQELKKYENHAKMLLLENLYFDELLSFMNKLNIEFRGRTTKEVFKGRSSEVFDELKEKTEESDGEIILSELDNLL